MAPAQATDAARVRIAIAFVALKYKPAAMGLAEYVLDLCEKFPSAGQGKGADAWLRRALELEGCVRELKGMYESEQIKCAALAASVGSSEASAPTPASAPPPKKKQKKNPKTQAEGPRMDLAAVISGIYANVPTASPSPGVLPAMRLLSSLTADDGPRSPEALMLIAAASGRAVGALGDVLSGVLSGNAKTVGAKQQETLQMICRLTGHVLSTGVSMLVDNVPKTGAKRRAKRAGRDLAGAVDDILGALLSRILVPAIRGFAVLSRMHIKSFCGAGSTKRTKKELAGMADMRADVLCLVETVLAGLDGGLAGLGDVREGVALAVLGELDRLYAEPSSGDGAGCAASRADRVEKLARKDAVWYLCGVLGLVSRALGHVLGGEGGVLRERIAGALEVIMKRVDGGPESGVLLAVFETAWLDTGKR
ncbi:hypothetical protein GLOTRDRAFT_135720 [Gloeophyllum trabeum ATCC 11539]|uniref:Uncharacterized protein n=1 Tax=Gloeophyllum trabeum (strain ATCC 11539 / FP-39264 / Madison 617) TaxID=670483 RepID=S7S182_GLOTA|nr:uncharacterized protein GLOTRDRAFT_135720 [Gloeophyllum trabeum ATCC 11539]EPQ61185.1 hypothetical protein GLOTRDRAFT_135720 [Gloeophyllum trabeum ATCC 11539]